MAEYPPFMNAYGKIKEILESARSAQTPDRFTHDYLATVLGHSGGSSRPFIAFAKRVGLLNSDGTPTDLYKRFRNPDSSGAAIAEAVRVGYSELYKRNEYAHKLSRDKIEGLLIEMTGLESGDTTLRAIARSFQALVELADFETKPTGQDADNPPDEPSTKPPSTDDSSNPVRPQSLTGAALGLSYQINIVLPRTDDPAVFNAIFRSLRENLIEP